MDKSKFKVYATAKETLDSCGMTREEFLSELDQKEDCWGFSTRKSYNGSRCCDGVIGCSNCIIASNHKTKEEIISWLNETVPEKSEILEFDYDKIMQENIVVHCETEEKANELLKWAHSKGFKWIEGSLLEYNYWDTYKEKTQYHFNNRGFVSFGTIDAIDKTILKYEDAILPSKFPSKKISKQLLIVVEKLLKKCYIDDVREKLKPTETNGKQYTKSERDLVLEGYLREPKIATPTFLSPKECDNGFARLEVPIKTLSSLQESTRYSDINVKYYPKEDNKFTIELNENKTEKEMKATILKEIRTLEEHKLYIEAIGLSKKDIKLVTDVTDNKLYLETIDQEEINLDKDLKDLDFTIKGEWTIDKKYDVSKTKSSISKGILKITVPVQKDRIQTVTVD